MILNNVFRYNRSNIYHYSLINSNGTVHIVKNS